MCSPQSPAGRAWKAAPAAAAATLAAALAFTGVPLAAADPGQAGPAAQASPAAPAPSGPTRQVETLDRAPVAVLTDRGVTLGWRMLGLDKDSVGFHVIRDGVQITYNQPPHPSFFIGEGMQTPASPAVFYAGKAR